MPVGFWNAVSLYIFQDTTVNELSYVALEKVNHNFFS